MKTKEEILEEEFGISIDAKNTTPMDKGECIRVMQNHAEQQSIAFAEWLRVNAKPSIFLGKYDYFGDKETYTTTELLNIFKNENK